MNKLIAVLCLCICAFGLYAQPKINSPYSRIGLGEIENENLAPLRGMGNLGAAFNHPLYLNFVNPAAAANLKSTAFEVGIHSEYASLSGNGSSEGVWSGNLTYVALGFPLINSLNRVLDRDRSPWSIGMGFNLRPYSVVGYNIVTSEFLPETDTVRYNFEGDGGTYQLLWNTAAKYRNFSFGGNLGFLFGKISRDHSVIFEDIAASYADIFTDEVSVSGITWRLGVQYTHRFVKYDADGKAERYPRWLKFGIYGNSATNINTNSSSLDRRFNSTYSALDTISNVVDLEGEGTLPAEFGLGVIYGRTDKWQVGIDFRYTGWEAYEIAALDPNLTLNNTFKISLGGEIIPSVNSYNNYGKRIRYRFGVFYRQDPRETLASGQLNNYGATVGFGLPVILPRQQKSFVNFAFEIGRLGADTGLSSTYGRLTLGFTLNDDSWFYKRKFN